MQKGIRHTGNRRKLKKYGFKFFREFMYSHWSLDLRDGTPSKIEIHLRDKGFISINNLDSYSYVLLEAILKDDPILKKHNEWGFVVNETTAKLEIWESHKHHDNDNVTDRFRCKESLIKLVKEIFENNYEVIWEE